MEDEKKVSLEKYGLINNGSLTETAKEYSKYDLKEEFHDFDENGNVVKTTYQTTRTLEDRKKHVLKLEVYDEDEFQVEMLSLDDKEVFKWVYDKNGNLKKEKELNKSLHAMRFIEKITVFTPNKYFICGNFKFRLQIIYEPNKIHNYDNDMYDIRGDNFLKWSTFTKNNHKFEDKEIVYSILEEDGIKQWTDKYLWNPELNSYEEWTYDKNNKLKSYIWKNPSNLNDTFSVWYDDKNKKVDLVYKKPNNKWTDKKINNIKFKDNDTFKNTVYYLLNKREEIKQRGFKFKLKQLENSETKGLKRQIRG